MIMSFFTPARDSADEGEETADSERLLSDAIAAVGFLYLLPISKSDSPNRRIVELPPLESRELPIFA